MAPDGPADAGHLVGQRDGRPVVPGPLFEIQRPLLQASQLLGVCLRHPLRREQGRARAVDEQRAQVDVAAPGDAAQ